jgi:hypothetical protein
MMPLSDFGVDLTRDLKAMADATGGIVVNDPGVWDQMSRCYQRYPSRYLSQVIGRLRGGDR